MVANTTAAKDELAKSYRVQAAMARTFTRRLPRTRSSRSHTGSRPRWPGCSCGESPDDGGVREVIERPRRDDPEIHAADPPADGRIREVVERPGIDGSDVHDADPASTGSGTRCNSAWNSAMISRRPARR